MNFSNTHEEAGTKLTGIVAVAVVHLVVIYALLNGLGKQVISLVKELPIEVRIIEEIKPPPPPPEIKPPTPPKVNPPPKAFIPPPEVPVPQTPVQNTITAVSNVQPAHQDFHPTTPAAPADTGPVVTKPQVDFSTCEKPSYPRSARANGNSGTVRIRFLIDTDGRVTETQIDKSSSYRDLDSAAENALSQCRFKPGTVDGKPQKSWTAVEYVWKLPN